MDNSPELVVTDEQVATLNAARSALDAIAVSCARAGFAAEDGRRPHAFPSAMTYGSVRALALEAADSLFRVLNWTNSHGLRDLTAAQLHNAEQEPAA